MITNQLKSLNIKTHKNIPTNQIKTNKTPMVTKNYYFTYVVLLGTGAGTPFANLSDR